MTSKILHQIMNMSSMTAFVVLHLIPGSWLTYNPTKVVEPLWNIPPTHCSTLSSSYNLTLHPYPPTLFIMSSTNRMMNNSWTMSHHHTGPATLSFIIFFTKLSPRCPHYDTEAFRTITFHFQKTFLISLLLIVSTIMSNIFMVNRRLT